jgi:hypothetical protein
MRRRSLLATLGAGFSLLSGCGGAETMPTSTDTGTATETETPTATPSPTDGTPSNVVQFAESKGWLPPGSRITTETLPRTYALSTVRYRVADGGEVRLKFDRTATADHPARLVASLQNTDRFREAFRVDWQVPFGNASSEQPHAHGDRRTTGNVTHADSLLFVPTENHDLVDDPPAVELADDGTWRLAEEPTRWQPEEVVLDPNEAVRGEYAVVGHPEGTGRPTGVYEFVRGQADPLKLTVWHSEEPGPTESSRFQGESVPPLGGDDASRVSWFHEADASTPTFVRPSTERAELPASVTFRFVNHAEETLGCGHWTLYKLHEGTWYDLGPYIRLSICYQEPPGGTDAMTYELFNGHGFDDGIRGDERIQDYIGGGRYAAVVGFGAETGRSGALLDIDADPVELVPTADATAERDGDRVVVTSDDWRAAADDDHRERTRLRLTRADAAERTLIREQVMQRRYRGLRNSLPFLEADVGEVVLRTDDSVADRTTGYDSPQARFRLDGQAYEIAVES